MNKKKKYALAMLSATSLVYASGLSQGVYADDNIGIVTASSLNVRSGPSTYNNIIGGVMRNQKIQIISSRNGWYEIKYSNKSGWVSGRYVSVTNSQTTTIKPLNKTLISTANLNVRSGGSTDHKIISYIRKGEHVDIIDISSSGWYRVKLKNGTVGYASNKYLKEDNNSSSNINNESNNLNDNALNSNSNDITIIDNLITTSNLNVRSGPSTQNNIIGYLQKGSSVNIVENKNSSWYKVKLSNGKVGYCSRQYLKSPEEINSIVQNTITSSEKTPTSQNINKTMNAKAYAYCDGTITSTGTKPISGRTIAVDPTIIPYGTKIYIPEFDKVFIAEDCGGGIKGNKIDIYMDTKEECISWGIRNIEIYILE